MKRRNFVKNLTLSSVAAPFLLNNMKFQAVSKKLFGVPKIAEDRVLVLIRMNGGNDGLNTLIPLDGYDNLSNLRTNIIIPQSEILSLTPNVGLHPVMTGMRDMFNAGNLGVIQNVGYPQQNRSHFRSMDIWSTGMMEPSETTGWIGRPFDSEFPNFPVDYPNNDNPDPFAISMGYNVSATCQGLMGNFSHAVVDPFDAVNLGQGSVPNDGTYYGDHMEYISTMIAQSNAYGLEVNDAANAGNTMSTLYDDNNPLAVQLRFVAQMISGGLKTKVFILNINGFDTHDSQVDTISNSNGNHAFLLKTMSDGIAAFQDDLNLLGLSNRVAGMTYSEFGRQIASNASTGTDHGDAAPLFLFGSCLSNGIMGPNPLIPAQVTNQQGVDMQIDFRDVYASVLKDWFVVDETEIESMFEHQVTFFPILGACNVGLDEKELSEDQLLLYPNPAINNTTLRIKTQNENITISAIDLLGKKVQTLLETTVNEGEHNIPLDLSDLARGQYVVQVLKSSGNGQVSLVKK
ncbi:MAG: hypothetical protein ACI9G9_001236 [Psychromonas sp.]|jgi:uncharacterized protein (DUF1501 family)